jgi:hypothetical protein
LAATGVMRLAAGLFSGVKAPTERPVAGYMSPIYPSTNIRSRIFVYEYPCTDITVTDISVADIFDRAKNPHETAE